MGAGLINWLEARRLSVASTRWSGCSNVPLLCDVAFLKESLLAIPQDCSDASMLPDAMTITGDPLRPVPQVVSLIAAWGSRNHDQASR